MRHDTIGECVRKRRRTLQYLRDRARVQTGRVLVRRLVHHGMLYEYRRLRDPVGQSLRSAGDGVYRVRRGTGLQRRG
jgi:hypothetical protein